MRPAAAAPGRYPSGVLRRALAVAILGLGSAAAAQLVDEVPLADVLEILELDGKLLAIDARTGGELELDLRLAERVQWLATRGRVGMALTDQRVLAVAVASGTWQQAELQRGEQVSGLPDLGDRVGLLLTSRRVLGFDGGSQNLIESSLGLRERVLATAVGNNVAAVVTDRRALGLSPTVGGFFDTPVQLGETIERIVAESNLVTVTTPRRLLIFRTPTGSWEIRLRNLR
jgi:hypothetical protein